MVFASNCSNTNSLGCIILIQLTNSNSLRNDVQLINKPFDPSTNIFNCQAVGSLLEAFLQSQWSLGQNIKFMLLFIHFGVLSHQFTGESSYFRCFLYLLVIHGEKLNFLHPASKTIHNLIQTQQFKRNQRIGLLYCFVIDQMKLLDLLMNHNPFPLLQIRHNLLLPRILLQRSLSIGTFHSCSHFETIRHCLKFIEESFFTCILYQVESRDLFIPCVVQLSDVHCHHCWKTTLDAQTYHRDVPAQTSSQIHHLILQLYIPIHCVLSIRNEHDRYRGLFWYLHQSVFQCLKSCVDIGHPTPVLSQILIQHSIFLKFGLLTKSNKKLCSFSNTLIPKFNHGLPI